MMPDHRVHPASYRDPSGFVFQSGSLFYRQVNQSYAADYDKLIGSGLYDALVGKGLLVSHGVVEENLTASPDWYKTLLPQQLAFISYPSEWSPAQLKDAALLTLKVLSIAIEHGMILKDATPLNVQFVGGKAVFIDTLSFEKYDATLPWVAYRQFCECLLFPLYLHHYLSTGTHWICGAWPEGIPARVTAGLLPMRSRFSLGVWLHVLLQSRLQRTHEGGAGGRRAAPRTPVFSKEKMLHLVNNLESIVGKMKTDDGQVSEWNNYYETTISSQDYLKAKERLFRDFVGGMTFAAAGGGEGSGSVADKMTFDSALDLGANDGYFSKILSEGPPSGNVRRLTAVDFDWRCIQRLYGEARQVPYPILPLVIDLSNPTPASGFQHTERASFTDRARSELVIALALIHHLALGRNIPLPMIAGYLAALTKKCLIVEFVPLSDEKSQELLRGRSRWQKDYDEGGFEAALGVYFSIERKEKIDGSERILYLMRRHGE